MKKFLGLAMAAVFLMAATQEEACVTHQPLSTSGVSQTTAKVKVGTDGRTVEQRNIARRLDTDNKPGSIKHLYVISSYSGQVILYSTVDGKVTSGGKRLTPTSTASGSGIPFSINGSDVNNYRYFTNEVIQDDGTYGSSVEYLYWFDAQGRYHQQYIGGGVTIHISDEPIPVKSVIINVESQARAEAQ